MCNRYRATDVVMIRDVFGFMYIESGPPRYKTTGIGPWQPGPFVIPAGVRVGQWGLIPWFSKTQRPTGRGGRPISTNNCRISSSCRVAFLKSTDSRCMTRSTAPPPPRRARASQNFGPVTSSS